MASTAETVLSYRIDGHDFFVTVDKPTGPKELRLQWLSRTSLMAFGKRINAFVGAGRPTDYNNESLVNFIKIAMVNKQSLAPVTAKPSKSQRPTINMVATPTPTTPKEEPMATSNTPSVDTAVQSLIESVLSTVTPQGNANLNEVQTMLDQLREELMREIASSKPVVNTVTVNTVPVGTVNGNQHFVFPIVLDIVAQRLNAYLVGPAGTGKSTIAENVAKSLGLEFFSMSCGPQTPESRLWGYMDANGNFVETSFYHAFKSGAVFLLDEIDNGHGGILATLNSVLANGFATFPNGETVYRHKDFVVLCGANTFGTGATAQFVGRNALDAATLDRFVFVEVPVDEQLESAILDSIGCDSRIAQQWLAIVRKARKNVEEHGLRVVVSPRATFHGAKLLASGNKHWTFESVAKATFIKGCTTEQATKVLAGTGVTL
jgi:cobaltochelatase CobS